MLGETALHLPLIRTLGVTFRTHLQIQDNLTVSSRSLTSSTGKVHLATDRTFVGSKDEDTDFFGVGGTLFSLPRSSFREAEVVSGFMDVSECITYHNIVYQSGIKGGEQKPLEVFEQKEAHLRDIVGSVPNCM